MQAPRRSTTPKRWAVVAFLLCVGSTQAEVWPLEIENSRCSCVLPTRSADDQYFLIVSSLARGSATHRIHLATEKTSDSPRLPLEKNQTDDVWRWHNDDLRERLQRARRVEVEESFPAPAQPPRQRTFHVFVGEQDFTNAESYATVVGELCGVGKYCQVYVDRQVTDLKVLQPTVDDALTTFDAEVFPRARQLLGHLRDVDRDGRFTILFTPWLAKMSSGKVSLGGFVRGSDFYRDLQAPFGNRCDMMYLNTDLKPGPHLKCLLAHEFTHAIVFSEHVFGNYLPDHSRQDEESWLNEALAHVMEDLHGHGWTNLDYRISAFLSDPSRYRLVVPDYYSSGLWRSHGHRGDAYLFLRWCVDRYGPELLGRLVQSNLSGIENLEVATGKKFANLYRQWTIDLLGSGGRQPSAESSTKNVSLYGGSTTPPRVNPINRMLCGPCYTPLSLKAAQADLELGGTSTAYYLLHSPEGSASRLTLTSEVGTQLQVSLIKVPEKTGRLELGYVAEGSRQIRLKLCARGSDCTIDVAAWERQVPKTNRPEDTSFRADEAAKMVQMWFGDTHFKDGQARTSAPIQLPDNLDSFLFKVSATDAGGHRISGWATGGSGH